MPSFPLQTITEADLIELKVDHSHQYSALDFGPRRSHEVRGRGYESEIGKLRVIFDFSEDRRIASIEFAAWMSGFLGEAYYQRLFARPCSDGLPEPSPGLAIIYDYSAWYENEGFFALYLDRSSDQARLCLRPLEEIGSALVEEDTTLWGEDSVERIVLEWDGELLVALRFEPATALLPAKLLDQAIVA